MAIQIHEVNYDFAKLPQRIERKFYVLQENLDFAYGLLRHLCRQSKDYPQEYINSLYFDTPDLDQHEKSDSGDFRKDKVRIRWYGREIPAAGTLPVYLELKSRQGFASAKQRQKFEVPVENLASSRLRDGILPYNVLKDTLSGFGYLPPEPLQPVIRISYYRSRFCEILSGQVVALDRRICSTLVMPGLGFQEPDLALPGGVIELKSRSLEIPLSLRKMRLLDLDWSRFSKYSACLDAHAEKPGTDDRFSPSGKRI